MEQQGYGLRSQGRNKRRIDDETDMFSPSSYSDRSVEFHNEQFAFTDDIDPQNSTPNPFKLQITEVVQQQKNAKSNRDGREDDDDDNAGITHSLQTENSTGELSLLTEAVPLRDLKCKVIGCVQRGSTFDSLTEFVHHHNKNHSTSFISKSRLEKLKLYHCGKCSMVFDISDKCEHVTVPHITSLGEFCR
jgi:hypothetical protein